MSTAGCEDTDRVLESSAWAWLTRDEILSAPGSRLILVRGRTHTATNFLCVA